MTKTHTLSAEQKLFYRCPVYLLRVILLLSALMLISLCSRAQLHLHLVNAIGTYSDRISITLDSGFTSEPTGSQSLYLYIDTSAILPLSEKPSNSQNYVITYTPRVSGISNPADTTLTNAQVMVGIQYRDGQGRPLQNIQIKGSPLGNDMVQPMAYDTMGRQTTQYLPYTAVGNNDGAYRSSAFTEQAAYYNPSTPGADNIATTNYPFAQKRYELSPLNRVLEQGAPGADWQLGAHTQGVIYTTNSDTALTSGGHWAKNYVVRSDGTLGVDDPYWAGQLNLTITHDENWTSSNGRLGTTETYTDKNGRLILKRTFNHNATTSSDEILSTYYVYDDQGNLRYILPPTVDPDNPTTVPSTLLQTWQCYRYIYDSQNRLIGKSIPGKGMNYIIYNKLDRPAMTLDAKQSSSREWTVYKYDILGRVIMTGVWDAPSAPLISAQQASVDSAAAYDRRDTSNTTTGYAINSFPTVTHPLIINYYDDYDIPNLPSAYDLHTDSAYSTHTQGLLTATKTAILKSDGTISSDMLWTVYYYDSKGRNIKTVKQHYLGGVQSVYNYDDVTITYDFTDNPTQTVRNHYAKNSGNTAAVLGVAIKDSLVYDHVDRPIQTWNQINNGTKVLLSQTDYNELGQASVRHIHSTDDGITFLQNVSYAYNERGWLIKNSAPMFAEQLKYNDGTIPQYNGNIANQLWGTPGSLGNTFTYDYDKINRLTSGSSATMSETGISYDLGGNIQSLTRDGHTISYTYGSTANDLVSVSGTGVQSGTYSYDDNGNVVHDGSNGFTFASNMLNLTRQASDSTQTISYTYDARGNKLSKSNTNTMLSEYTSGIQYRNNAGSYGIDFVAVPGGAAMRKSDGSYRYEYDLTDHLGNVRASIQENPTTHLADTIQKDDYYPFGLRRSLTAGDNKYLYNGKEQQEEFNQYDYGARFYNPAIGRWNGLDLLAEAYNDLSPYHYVINNPISNIDLNGMGHEDLRYGHFFITDPTDQYDYKVGELVTGASGAVYEWKGEDEGWELYQLPPEVTDDANVNDTHPANNNSYGQDYDGGGAMGGDMGGIPYSYDTSGDGDNGGGGVFGSTTTMKTGWEYTITSRLGDKATVGSFNKSSSGKESLLNINITSKTTQRGKTSIETDANLNLYVLKFKFTRDGVEHQIGTDSWNISLGFSIDKGFSLNSTINGTEINTSFRPGGGALGGALLGVGLFFVPEAAPVIIKSLEPAVF